ncbi:MAG: sn-glycerol-3-phosphate ABC transporter ATP-binding protein UgpC [Eubacterium sp.]|nr:sn-glycerol-3-phosphate ABC transporter ATP-binding protein UgpC [Eubacterium sp.]
MAGIRFNNVRKTYDNGVTVIEDLNLNIEDKEFIVLVGPSGCGKSTTLRMIAGLESISDGDLFIGDKRVNNVAPKNRNIAMVFQSYALYPHMTVYKNMAFALEMMKTPKKEIDEKVREAAKILALEPYLDRKPKELSGGQRQRVALGRAMVRNPEVFLLDEPLSNLDAKLRTEMRSQIKSLHKRLQTTFVYVTHDQTEAMTMGDRICVMKDGVIQQIDTPQNIYNNPVNVFVAGFIGSPQMNFINAKVEEESGKNYLVFADNRIEYDREEINDYRGKEVIIGIRPENIHDPDSHVETDKSAEFTAKIDIAELMGSEIYLYMKFNNDKLIARVSARTDIKTDDMATLRFDVNKFHIFDKETENIICN